MKNDVQIWPETDWKHIEGMDDEGINHNLSTAVDSNDMIYFVVNQIEAAACDATIWNPVIEYKTELKSESEL